MLHRLRVGTLLLASLAAARPAPAQTARDSASQLCVDVVTLHDARELRGSVLERRQDGSLSIAVQRDWLQAHEPALSAEHNEREQQQRRAAYETLVARIRTWLEARAADQELAATLRQELEGYERIIAAPVPADAGNVPASQFAVIECAAKTVRRVLIQPPRRKQAGLAAFQARLPDVEQTPLPRLEKLLRDHDPDWQRSPVDLSDRLPPAAEQSEREWAARQALYEYAFRQRIDFQGTGDAVFRTDPKAERPPIAELIAGALQGDLAKQLSGLLSDPSLRRGPADRGPSWFDKATETATREHVPGFRVTRLEHDLPRRQVTVDCRFLARMPDGTWESVWQHREAADASKPRKDLETRIKDDPQVADALKVAKSLGLDANVDMTLRFAAATMEAQQTADDRFFAFRDRYTQRLDGPPLRWESTPKP
jgi:hypothetical protein